jgi:hypothetical protein
VHLRDDEAGAVNEIFHINAAAIGEFSDRLIAMGYLDKAVKAIDSLAVKPFRFISLVRE